MAEGKLEDAKESRAFEISQLQNVITMLKSNNWVNGSHIDLVRFVNQQTQRGGSILPGMFHLAWHMLFFSTTKLGEDVFSRRKAHIITHDPLVIQHSYMEKNNEH